MRLRTLIAFSPLFVILLLTLRPVTAGDDCAFIGATVYPSPGTPPISNAAVLTSSGKIAAVGKRAGVKLPASVRVIDCSGKVIVAGFWDSHVHFSDNTWLDAANAPSQKLTKHMQEMLTQWGFTTVWDLGSDPNNSLALRRRVESGEIPGPRILLAGSEFPKGGHPVYLPPEMQLPEVASPDEAAQLAQNYMRIGLEGIKLFTGSYMGNKPVINMDIPIVMAAVNIAHAENKPVFAHPQNRTGVDNAVAGGVDILAHTVPSEPDFTADELTRFKTLHTALIPTLTLWTTVVQDPAVANGLVASGVQQLKTFSANGGPILFGTDVGFTTNYDTRVEFELMRRALSVNEILASLTANPAAYFKASAKGRVEKGFDADLVILDGDPASDVRNLAKVAYTIRAGKIIYQK